MKAGYKWIRGLGLLVLSVAMICAVGCQQAEEAGEDTGEAMEEAGEATMEAAEEAGAEMEEAAEEAEEEM